MSKSIDWIPHDRQNLITLSRNWLSVFGEEMETKGTDASLGRIKKYAAWNIPPETFAELGTRYAVAEEALSRAKEKETRTEVVNAACRTAFAALVDAMRNIKKRYLYVPPLTDSDLVSLGLKVRDKNAAPGGTPTAQVTIETYLVGRRQLGLRFIYVSGNPDDPANKEFRVYYKVVAHGEKAPETPDELAKSFSTKRKKDVLDFDFGDSGKTAYFCVQIENDGRKGPWGPMISAIIP